MNEKLLSKESSITVTVRVRPFTENEANHLIKPNPDQMFLGDASFSNGNKKNSTLSKYAPKGIRKIINVVDDRMLIFDPPESNPLNSMQKLAFPGKTTRIREHRFVFDQLFDEESQQEDIYSNTTKPLLDSILDGYNATVFAYGATGCGKTHTITGTPDSPGIIFLTMRELYDRIDKLRDTQIIEVSLSYLEIYNETIRDLLNPTMDHKTLNLREDAKKKITVVNLSSHKPTTVEAVMDLILQGNHNRTMSPTEANATSSRSHAVLQINIIQKDRTADISENHTFATLSIIDLAGSERAAATRNRGERLHEGANINKSLLALGNCINALCDPRRRNHVPYRDSKLTRLLKFSLGGNCKTVMIVCVSPSSQHYDETLNTLKYANRAKEIKTKVIRNQHNLDRHVGSYLKMITEQKQEIEELRAREAKIVEITVNRQNLLSDKCLNSLLESIDSLKMSINKQSAHVVEKSVILAKRKLLFLEKKQMEGFLSQYDERFKFIDIEDSIHGLKNWQSLCESIFSNIELQINELEYEYSKENEIDHILNTSSRAILRKLTEMENWSEYNNLVFESHILSLREMIEKDILFNSSILFDQLVHHLGIFDFLTSSLLETVALLAGFESEPNLDSMALTVSLKNVVTEVNDYLQKFLSGEFNQEVEKYCYSFKQSVNNPSSTISLSQLSAPRSREGKRGSMSPLRSSPARTFKKTITKKNSGYKSPIRSRSSSKKVRWNMPSTETDSDTSMEDLSQLANENKDTITPQKQGLLDDLDIKFDPILDSPQTQDSAAQNREPKKVSLVSRPIRSSLTSKKLLGTNTPSSLKIAHSTPMLNLNSITKMVMPKVGDRIEMGEDHNDQGSSVVTNAEPSETILSPKARINSLGAPSRLQDRLANMDDFQFHDANAIVADKT